MPDYQDICSRLIARLCDVVDAAKAAIEEAEESIISDEQSEE